MNLHLQLGGYVAARGLSRKDDWTSESVNRKGNASDVYPGNRQLHAANDELGVLYKGSHLCITTRFKLGGSLSMSG